MAGNFILVSITQSDLNTAILFPNISWSNQAAHKKGDLINPDNKNSPRFTGWDLTTRHALKQALSGNDIGNREKLPPHRYLEIKAWGSLSEKEQNYIKGAGWAEKLVYPSSNGLGLKALDKKAEPFVKNGNMNEALITTLKKGAVSIEVYYQSGIEMY